jgi:hypothetical protein
VVRRRGGWCREIELRIAKGEVSDTLSSSSWLLLTKRRCDGKKTLGPPTGSRSE